jgi:hypothetical protein
MHLIPADFTYLQPVLVSNSFPFGLVRRPLRVTPGSIEELREVLRARRWLSAWGHENTVAVASDLVGVDLRPAVPRPVLTLDVADRPLLGSVGFEEIWLLTPEYAPGFRPPVGREVEATHIVDWRVLHLWFDPLPVREQGPVWGPGIEEYEAV